MLSLVILSLFVSYYSIFSCLSEMAKVDYLSEFPTVPYSFLMWNFTRDSQEDGFRPTQRRVLTDHINIMCHKNMCTPSPPTCLNISWCSNLIDSVWLTKFKFIKKKKLWIISKSNVVVCCNYMEIGFCFTLFHSLSLLQCVYFEPDLQ